MSVLIQDRDSGKILLDAAIGLNAKPAAGIDATIRARANRQQSTNKLPEAARLNLATPGTWELDLARRRGGDEGSLSTQLNVEPSDAEQAAGWLCFLLGRCSCRTLSHLEGSFLATFLLLLPAALVLIGRTGHAAA